MALLRTKEIRAKDAPTREKKLRELQDELMHERGVAAMGGAPPNPGKIRALRKNLARLHTIDSEERKRSGAAASSPSSGAPQSGASKEPTAEATDDDLEEDQP